MKQKFYLILIYLIVSSAVYSQITTDELPTSFTLELNKTRSSHEEDVKRMPNIDVKKLYLEDDENDKLGLPPRYGFTHLVDLNLENSGVWTKLSNGDRLWRLTILCPEAISIDLDYDKFWLPKGSKFFVYTKDNKQTIGAITSELTLSQDRNSPRGFGTGTLMSEEVVLEYYEPANVKTTAIISISSIIHGYKKVNLVTNRNLSKSSTEYININCPEGEQWQNEKNAVAFIRNQGYVNRCFLFHSSKTFLSLGCSPKKSERLSTILVSFAFSSSC